MLDLLLLALQADHDCFDLGVVSELLFVCSHRGLQVGDALLKVTSLRVSQWRVRKAESDNRSKRKHSS